MTVSKSVFVLTFGALTLAAPVAQAAVITGTSQLTVANAAIGGGIGDFGQVAINLDNVSGTASFTFTGHNGWEFVDSGVADVNLIGGFSATNGTAIGTSSPNNLTVAASGSGVVDGFGIFSQTTTIGSANIPQTSLSYSLTSATFVGLTSISQLLVFNGLGFDAAAHVCNVPNGGCAGSITGFVGETSGGVIPEPTSLALLGGALVGLGVLARRRPTTTA